MMTPAFLMMLSLGAPTTEALPAVGEAAPVFRLRDLAGSIVRLDELAYPGKEKAWAKKRPLLLDFFRTDCRPCREAVPELSALHERYRAAGLEVLMIALLESEQGRSKLESYLKEAKLPFKVAVDESEHFTSRYLGKEAKLPATFLIDREGKIRHLRRSGGPVAAVFEPKIKELLSAPSQESKP